MDKFDEELINIVGPIDNYDSLNVKVERTYSEYYSRYVRIKNVIEALPEIKMNIDSIFCMKYLQNKPDDTIFPFLGTWSKHSAYSIYGGTLFDNGHENALALLLKPMKDEDNRFYRIKDISGSCDYKFFCELNSFRESFLKGENPPYFVGPVVWFGPGHEEGIAGLITADPTMRGTLESSIRSDFLTDYLQVIDADGFLDEFFIGMEMPNYHGGKVSKYAENPINVYH